jgi:hypothetical protein
MTACVAYWPPILFLSFIILGLGITVQGNTRTSGPAGGSLRQTHPDYFSYKERLHQKHKQRLGWQRGKVIELDQHILEQLDDFNCSTAT